MPRPINTLEAVPINGVRQWVLLQSRDTSLPVLLVLHGGPGYAILPLFHGFNAALEDDFVVVNWDQRGAGRSYSREVPRSSMTLRQFLDDVRALAVYLKERFRQPKIYVLGHSFGTVLGLLAVQRHPDDYHAYVGVGQVVGIAQNEITMYEWVLRRAEEEHHARATKDLRRIGHPDAAGQYPGTGPRGADPYDVAEHWMAYFGGELYGKRDSAEVTDWLLRQSEYHGRWGRKWLKGLAFSARLFDEPALWGLDFRKAVTAVATPVYFLQGRHDYDTPAPLVADYAPTLAAPRNELIWFERSAHFPFYEQADDFNRCLVQVVKASTYPGRPATGG
jgi:pimeloyl-ACP methyl ester carboxylesterase